MADEGDVPNAVRPVHAYLLSSNDGDSGQYTVAGSCSDAHPVKI
jgi:hypothetical protein